MSGSNEEKKVLLAGLPNSGLSTIKAIIDNNPPKELKPIIQKLNIGNSLKDLLHGRLFLIRCGGNESINDLLSPTNDPLFKNVEALVYILDLAEQANYSIARYWFEAIKNHIHKFSPNARIFIFLHKTDLLEGNKLTNYISAAKNLFNEGDTEIYFHETSVYDASIFMAFRDVLLKEMDEKISVKQYFSQALKDSNFACLAVFSKDGLPIYEIGELPEYVRISANVLLGTVDRITKEVEEDDKIQSTILQTENNTFLVFQSINEKSILMALSKKQPRFGQMLVELEQYQSFLKKAIEL